MPKSYKKMSGGMFESVENTFSNLSNSISQGASNLGNTVSQSYTKAKNYVTGTPSYSTMGGKTKKYHKRGGSYSANTPLTGLAAHASPISGIKSAQPHQMVGGKTKKRKHRKRSKSHRRK
jgi:hypothetical protein